jgi:hypothetical protein
MGGPTYEYRGAIIEVNPLRTVYSFTLGGFPPRGWGNIADIEQIIRLVDAWLDTGKLPPLRLVDPDR